MYSRCDNCAASGDNKEFLSPLVEPEKIIILIFCVGNTIKRDDRINHIHEFAVSEVEDITVIVGIIIRGV